MLQVIMQILIPPARKKKEQNRNPLKDTQKIHYAIYNRTKTQKFTGRYWKPFETKKPL